MSRRLVAVLCLMFLLIPQQSFAASISGQSCSKKGATKKYQKVTYVCAKVGKKTIWKAAVKAEPSPKATPQNPTLLVSPVPIGEFNTTFMLGKPQSRDIGESIYIENDSFLSSLQFNVGLVTWITPEYHSAPEEQKHIIERTIRRGEGQDISTQINVSLWRDDQSQLEGVPIRFDLRNGFTRITEFEVKKNFQVGENVTINFPTPVEVTKGYYYLNLFFVTEDLHVTTLRFSGRQTGNNTMGGPNKDMPSDCKYTPAKDLYPRGQAYYSYQDTNWDKKSPDEKWNYQTPRSYTFKLHDYAKVSECTILGQYNDILNTGDIFLDIYGVKK